MPSIDYDINLQKIFIPRIARIRSYRKNLPRYVVGLLNDSCGMHTQSYDIYNEFPLANYDFRKVDYQEQKYN